MKRLNLLHIEDNPLDTDLIARHLEQHGVPANIRRVYDSSGIANALDEGSWDVILADYVLRNIDLHEALKLVRARFPDTPIILVSRSIVDEKAAVLLKEGLWDVVLKNNLSQLQPAIERGLRESNERRGRREAEIALRASELRYRSVFENSMDGVFLTTPDGSILDANQEAQRIFGYTVDEFRLVGRAGVVDASDGRLAKALAERDKTGQFRGELTQIRKGGEKFAAEVSSKLFKTPDGRLMTSMAIRDISVQKSLERELQERRNELESLQKSQIAAQTALAIAHELNQPLLAVASYSKAALMLLDAENPDMHKIRETLEKSERQTIRTGEAIRRLVDYLSVKEFPSETFDLNQEIIGVLNTVRSQHELQFNSALQLEKNLPMVRANRIHIQRVLFNLLHNGIEAMQYANVPLPAITVTVRTINEKKMAQVTIQDNGPGFTKEEVQRLFEPFFTTKTGGIGMGLAISRSLIEMNGGQLWHDPEEGPGATFHLTLPFSQ
jgi:two-component system sensor kinase FixL